MQCLKWTWTDRRPVAMLVVNNLTSQRRKTLPIRNPFAFSLPAAIFVTRTQPRRARWANVDAEWWGQQYLPEGQSIPFEPHGKGRVDARRGFMKQRLRLSHAAIDGAVRYYHLSGRYLS